MISDVPGYTWGTVTAMAQAGIRYFSVAPELLRPHRHDHGRMGEQALLVDRPGRQEQSAGLDPVLGLRACRTVYGRMSPQLVADFCEGLQNRDYPYDIAYVRWAGHGDNAVPDPAICDFVKDWNARTSGRGS